MAMTTCWECMKEISDTAAHCPHCGAAGTASTMVAPLTASPEKKTAVSNWLAWMLGLSVALLLLTLAIGA